MDTRLALYVTVPTLGAALVFVANYFWIGLSLWITVPMVFAVMLLSLLLILRIVVRRVEELEQAEFLLCPTCGYSLARSPRIGKCPECGEAYHHATIRQQWFDSTDLTSGVARPPASRT